MVEVVVEPDACGQGEESGGDPGAQSVQGARAVTLEAEAFLGLLLEVAAGVALVGDDELATVQATLKQSQRDVALFLIG